MLGLFALTPRIDPRKESYEKHRKAYDIFRVFMTLFFIALTWVINAAAMGWPCGRRTHHLHRPGRYVSGAWKLHAPDPVQLYLRHQDALDPGKPPLSGRKLTPWAESSSASAACLTIVAGIFAVSWAMYVMLAVILLGSLWLYVYSWLLYRKER